MKIKRLFTLNKVAGRLMLFALFTLLHISMMAQQKLTVQGKVTSADDGQPLPGVTVLVKGTKTGATSDFDGNYSVVAKTGDVLEFSYIGMDTKSIKVTQAKQNVSLASNIEGLDEVVVIGYGTVTKKELTGAVSQVKAKDIEEYVTSDLASALQGQIAGVNISASSGQPGESADIQIRGITSLSGSNTPLFVVDGIPQQGDPRLSPNEIETIDVLKDAASAAVYGTRGAAGVILITTKRGKEGRVNVTIDSSYGLQYLGDGVPLMNTEERLLYDLNKYTYTPSPFIPGPYKNVDWLNNDNKFSDYVLVNGAATSQTNLNVSGGAKNFSYNAVGGYFDQEGTLINSGFKRYNARATTTYKSDNWNINTSVAFTIEDIQTASSGLIVNALRYPSYYPLIDSASDVVYHNGSGGVTTPQNVLASSLKRKDNSNRDKINGSLSISRKLTDELRFTSRVGTAVTNFIQNVFIPKYTSINVDDQTSETDPTKSLVEVETSRATTFSWDGSLDFKKKFNGHTVSVLANMSLDENNFESFLASKQGVANNSIEVLDGATINPTADSGFKYTTKIVGFLGRFQYDYEGKYLFSAVARRDGSSKFGKDYRWGTFPSFSAGWNVSDENFWSDIKPTINNFKIRASYGTVGNESFSPYEYASSIVQGSDYIFDEKDGAVEFGTSIKSYSNRDVKWETSVSKNIGVDLSFLKNKITLTADYYDTQKKDMLFPVELPGSAGAYYDSSITLNVGDMNNKGIELAAKYFGQVGGSKIDIGATFTKNTNVITKMTGSSLIYNSNSSLISGDGASVVTVLAEGYEAGAFFLYETNGVIQTQEQLDAYRSFPSRQTAQLGDLIYVDYDEDGDITTLDRHYMGSALPDFEVGLNLKWTYKNLDLSMNWYGTVGAEIMNGTKAATYSFGSHRDLVNMWTPNNTTSQIPLQTGDSKSGNFNYVGTTDLWLENGDYLRLKLISLGYTVPEKLTSTLGLSSLRFYVTSQNPITITNYEGYDPEVGGNNVARRGLDVSRYPLTALYTFGVKLNF